MESKDPTKEQMQLEKIQEENCWKYETLNGWPRLAVWGIKSLTAYLNYFSYTANIHKIKKNPEIIEVEMKSIVGVLPKKNLSAPYDGWSALESSLEIHGYSPEKFNYIELNRERIIIEGKHRLCLMNIKHRNPLYKVKVKMWDVDVFKSNMKVTRRRLVWNSLFIIIVTTLILLLM